MRGFGEQMKCHHCPAAPVTVFWFDQGCLCSSDRGQALCGQHIISTEPVGGMELRCVLDRERWEFLQGMG